MRSLVHILPSGSVGGAPNNVIRMIDKLSEITANFEHQVLVPFDNAEFVSRLSDRGVQAVDIAPAANVIRAAFQVFKYFAKQRIRNRDTVMVTHGRGAGFVYRPIAILLGLRSVHFYRGFEPCYTLSSALLYTPLKNIDKFLNHFSTVIAVGKDEYDALMENLAPRDLQLIRNLVPDIQWPREPYRPIYDFAAVGRRSYQKGFDRYIKLASETPGLKFLWVGAEENSNVDRDEIPENLEIREYMPINEVFSKARSIICLSRWEGCSTVLTECIMSSKPFVTLKCPGAGEFHVRGKNDQFFYEDLQRVCGAITAIARADLSTEVMFNKTYFREAMDPNINARKLYTVFSQNSSNRQILSEQ